MHDTGRLKSALKDELQALVFGNVNEHTVRTELKYYAKVDKAHILMLSECGLLSVEKANSLLSVIKELENNDFGELIGYPAPRGSYLAYENYIIERLGSAVGGVLQMGRSRNDLNATVFRLRFREYYTGVLTEVLTLLETIVDRAAQESRTIMPAYTHYQAAYPTTLGHYLSGVIEALLRDTNYIMQAADPMHTSPLGSGAGGGTTLPINTERTAQLMGFTGCVTNSTDAVASRDLAIRILGALSLFCTTISRFNADLLLWSSQEYMFIKLPDDLVGSSSMMPQKRNPFLLEHIKGKTAAFPGYFTQAVTATHAVPFGNSVSVGTESLKYFWQAIDEVKSVCQLLTPIVSNFEINPNSMQEAMINGFVDATYYAEVLVLEGGRSFRDAHHCIGGLVNESEHRKIPLSRLFHNRFPDLIKKESTMIDALEGLKHGHGPGATYTNGVPVTIKRHIESINSNLFGVTDAWKISEKILNTTIDTFVKQKSIVGDDNVI